MTRNRKGISLIEMMVAVGGFAVLMAAVLGVFGLSLTRYREGTDRNEANGSALWALEFAKRDIRNASKVEPSYSSFTTTDQVLVLSDPSYTDSGVVGGAYDYIVYSVDSNHVLLRTTWATSGTARTSEVSRPLARNVKSFKLVYKVHDSFICDGLNKTFTLSANWSSAPIAFIDGTVVNDNVIYNTGNLTAQLPYIPVNGTAVEFVYPVAPSNSMSLSYVSEVNLTVTTQEPYSGSLKQFTATARMRNRP